METCRPYNILRRNGTIIKILLWWVPTKSVPVWVNSIFSLITILTCHWYAPRTQETYLNSRAYSTKLTFAQTSFSKPKVEKTCLETTRYPTTLKTEPIRKPVMSKPPWISWMELVSIRENLCSLKPNLQVSLQSHKSWYKSFNFHNRHLWSVQSYPLQ